MGRTNLIVYRDITFSNPISFDILMLSPRLYGVIISILNDAGEGELPSWVRFPVSKSTDFIVRLTP